MSEMAQSMSLQQDHQGALPAVRAAAQLWAEIERAQGRRDDADSLIKRLATTLETLLDGLPAIKRDDYRLRLAKLREIASGEGHGKEVHNNIIGLFKRAGHRDLSIPEIQTALNKAGEEADPKLVKAIYNALNYLAKKGTIRRVSWGQYVFSESGAGVAENWDHVVPDDGRIRRSENDD